MTKRSTRGGGTGSEKCSSALSPFPPVWTLFARGFSGSGFALRKHRGCKQVFFFEVVLCCSDRSKCASVCIATSFPLFSFSFPFSSVSLGPFLFHQVGQKTKGLEYKPTTSTQLYKAPEIKANKLVQIK